MDFFQSGLIFPVLDSKVIIMEVTAGSDMTDLEQVIKVGYTVSVPALPTIVELAIGNKDFSTLVTAVQAAGLLDELNAPGPFTVFAPTNDAFALVKNLDAIIADTDVLTDLLMNHVVSGAVFSSDISNGQVVQTLGGKDLTFTVGSDGGVLINNAPVVLADVEASNGVVHVIGEVITFPPALPALPTIVELAIGNKDFSTLVTAV